MKRIDTVGAIIIRIAELSYLEVFWRKSNPQLADFIASQLEFLEMLAYSLEPTAVMYHG